MEYPLKAIFRDNPFRDKLFADNEIGGIKMGLFSHGVLFIKVPLRMFFRPFVIPLFFESSIGHMDAPE